MARTHIIQKHRSTTEQGLNNTVIHRLDKKVDDILPSFGEKLLTQEVVFLGMYG